MILQRLKLRGLQVNGNAQTGRIEVNLSRVWARREGALPVVVCDEIDFAVGIDLGKPKLHDSKIRRFPEIGI
jgi:hypothetical protein